MLTQKNEEAIEMIAENNIPQLAMTPALQEIDNHWYSNIIFFWLHLVAHLFRLGGNSMYMKMYIIVQIVPWKNLRIFSLLQGNCPFVKRNVRSPAWDN